VQRFGECGDWANQTGKGAVSRLITVQWNQSIGLMGAKMKASQLLYGMSSGLSSQRMMEFPDAACSDVLRGAKLDDLQSYSPDDSRVSHNPLGCPYFTFCLHTYGAVTLQTWQQWAEDHNYVKNLRNEARK